MARNENRERGRRGRVEGGSEGRSVSRSDGDGGRRPRGEETYRVCFDRYEVEELRDLIHDVDGDADEDVLETAREALSLGMKRDMAQEDRIVLRLTRGEKDACRRAIDATERAEDRKVLDEVGRKIQHALEKHAKTQN